MLGLKKELKRQVDELMLPPNTQRSPTHSSYT
jgi:hypothetical protein